MKVVLAQPRGFCAGVVRVIDALHRLGLGPVELSTKDGLRETAVFPLPAALK
ncbi:hypothetical protein [Burkholderia ubonensis]|uniref:hypothetical protein n=1 Tax=Burkholderia ubonensis TaxID=101571 RepID=UPI000ABCF2D5|nr:hypothetical protein [Burkholderia ubonensis]